MTENIKVKLSKHAQYDCIPLRFGFVPSTPHGMVEAVLDKAGTSKQKPIEIKDGKKHYRGKLTLKDGKIIEDAVFVIAPPSPRYAHRTVISVMLEVGLATRAVSDLIRSYREEDKFDSQFIAKRLHRLYVGKKIKTETDFVQKLVEIGVEVTTKSVQEIANERIKAAEEKAEKERQKRISTEEKLEQIMREAIAKDGTDAQYKNEDIETSPVCKLLDVKKGRRVKVNGDEVNCTILEFEEDVPDRIMDEWADPKGVKTDFAKTLIGEKVFTTVWRPEVFSPLEWFRNIYAVEDE